MLLKVQKIIDQQIVELQADQSQLQEGSEGYNEIQQKSQCKKNYNRKNLISV